GVQGAWAREPYHLVPQILALHKDKNDKNDHDTGGGKGVYQGGDQRHQCLKRARIRLFYFNGDWLVLGWIFWPHTKGGGGGISLRRLIKFFAEFFQYLRGPLQRSSAGCRS